MYTHISERLEDVKLVSHIIVYRACIIFPQLNIYALFILFIQRDIIQYNNTSSLFELFQLIINYRPSGQIPFIDARELPRELAKRLLLR